MPFCSNNSKILPEATAKSNPTTVADLGDTFPNQVSWCLQGRSAGGDFYQSQVRKNSRKKLGWDKKK